MSTLSGTVIGMDFGTSKIGIAVGQTITQTSRPLLTIKSKKGKPNWAELDQIIKEWQPVALVVGRPVHMDGTEQEMTEKADKFARQLEQHYRLPLFQIDERLSSHEAESLLDEAYGKQHYAREEVDKLAASLILQTWLQQQ
ncbi:MAG: Holliday junction resolvase RuvX [Gammaproteobacteria bacterium]|nr:Holliday junction resolvase RuvX [Gammaproteobacteria bacterium]